MMKTSQHHSPDNEGRPRVVAPPFRSLTGGSSEKIKVLVCDDHTLFREGIKAILKEDPSILVVGEADNGREAVDKAHQSHPDVILMDIAMPELSGFEATRRIRKTDRRAKILILTMYEEEDVIARCLDAGASGYVLKDAPLSHLVHAIDVVHKGGQYLSPRALKKVVQQYIKGVQSATTPYDQLSDRERETLQLL